MPEMWNNADKAHIRTHVRQYARICANIRRCASQILAHGHWPSQTSEHNAYVSLVQIPDNFPPHPHLHHVKVTIYCCQNSSSNGDHEITDLEDSGSLIDQGDHHARPAYLTQYTKPSFHPHRHHHHHHHHQVS